MNERPVASPAPGGLLAAVRAIALTLFETARVRGELFATEFNEEVERRKHMLLLAAIAIVMLHMALLLLALLVAAAFWDTHRIEAIGTMAVLYLAGGATALFRMRAAIAASPAPFAATLGELNQDLDVFRPPR